MGHRIELFEIEAAFSEWRNGANCCVLYDESEKRMVLFYEGEIKKSDIVKNLSDRLAKYKIPQVFVGLKKMPLKERNKVDREALYQEYKKRSEEIDL